MIQVLVRVIFVLGIAVELYLISIGSNSYFTLPEQAIAGRENKPLSLNVSFPTIFNFNMQAKRWL